MDHSAPSLQPARAEDREQASPFLGLPVELLARILHLAVHESSSRQNNMLSNLLSVCQRLRAIALRTPSLWTKLTFTETTDIDYVSRWAEQSGILPLDVEITVQCRNHKALPCKQDFEGLMRCLTSLKPFVPRWRTLNMNLPSCWLAQEALSYCSDSLSQLDTLIVRTGHSDRGDYATPMSSILSKMPYLRVIEFYWYNFRWESVPLPSIKSISFNHYFMDDPEMVVHLLGFVRSCTNLEALMLQNIAERYTYPALDPTSISTMASLKLIALKNCGLEKAEIILSSLHYPNLVTLEVVHLGNIDNLLTVLTSRDLPHLTSLTLTSCNFREANLIKLLDKLLSLEALHIIDCDDVVSGVLTHISEPSGSTLLAVPRLMELAIGNCQSLDLDALIRVVTARTCPAGGKKRVKDLHKVALTGIKLDPSIRAVLQANVFLQMNF